MKKREMICALCLSAVLSVTGVSAVRAAEITEESIQAVTADSAGELTQEIMTADSSSAGPDSAQGEPVSSGNDSFIIEEPGSAQEETSGSEEDASPVGDVQEQADFTLDLVIEEQTVVEDPGMVDSRKIEEGVEALAKAQEDSLIPRLFRSNVVYNIPEVMNTVYSWLRNDMGFNHAAACGVLANIQYESGANPGAVGDGGTSYGLCQWHNSRCRSLIGYCVSRDMAFTSVEGQLAYLNHELSGGFQGVRNYLYNVPDTAQGAYDAASVWCRHFEMPLNTALEALKRGEFAANVLFWKDFSALTQEDLDAMEETADTENTLLMPEGQMDGLQVAYTSVLSSAVEESGAQLIQDVKECCGFVDNVVQTGKEVCSYLGDKFHVPEETVEAGLKDLVTGGYSRYEQMQSE